jgi:hypothetical protein
LEFLGEKSYHNEMGCATRNFCSRFESQAYGVCAFKRWQKRRMEVYDLITPAIDKSSGQNSHKSGQTNQLNSSLFESLKDVDIRMVFLK